MPTYAFTRTLPQLVSLVLRKLGAIGIDQTASPEDTAVVREAFDLRLKELHALGLLWFNIGGATTDLALTANVATKSLSAVTDFLLPVSVMLRVGSDDYPVEIISHRQYQAIQGKTETGEPSKVAFRNGTTYWWPVPNANMTAKLTYEAIAEDTTSTGAVDIPVSMIRPLASIVAGDLLVDFGVEGQRAARIEREAEKAERILMTLNAQTVDNTTVEMTSF